MEAAQPLVEMAPCMNCGKLIEKAKLHLHEAYCRRNMIRCDICKEMVNKNELEEHKEECMQIVEAQRQEKLEIPSNFKYKYKVIA